MKLKNDSKKQAQVKTAKPSAGAAAHAAQVRDVAFSIIDTLEGLLDVAAMHAREQEEVDAVGRMRIAIRQRLVGEDARWDFNDLIAVFSILAMFAREGGGIPQRVEPAWLPSVAELWGSVFSQPLDALPRTVIATFPTSRI